MLCVHKINYIYLYTQTHVRARAHTPRESLLIL